MMTSACWRALASSLIALLFVGCPGGEGFDAGPLPLVEVNNGFRPDDHGFSFANYASGEDVPVVDTSIARRLFGDEVCQSLVDDECVLSPAAEAWIREVNGTTEGGHCEGFAVLAQLAWSGEVDLTPFGGTTAASIESGEAIQREISYWYATQWSSRVHEVTQQMTVNEIATYLQTELAEGKAGDNFRLGLLQVQGSEVTGGHALTPFSIEKDGAAPPDGDVTKWKIGVYDSNFPGETRFLHLDTVTDSWRYQADDGDEGLFEGGPGERNRIYVVPSSARTGTQPCHFCTQGGTEERHIVGFKGPLSVDVYDEERNRAGESEDGLVSEINGVRVLPIFTNLALDRPPYIFDASENSCATVVARTIPAEPGQSDEISITSTLNGNTTTVGGTAGEGTHYLDLSPEGNEPTYHTDTGNGGPLTTTVPANDGSTVTASVETQGSSSPSGEQVLGLKVDPETGDVEIHFESEQPQDVRVTMKVVEEDGSERHGIFMFDDMESGTLATGAADFTGYEAAFDYDMGDTGFVDEVIAAPACASSSECPPFGSDADNVADDDDNCPGAYNPEQRDMDGDGAGDACDGDKDDDGLADNLDCSDYDASNTDICNCPVGTWDDDGSNSTGCADCSAGEHCAGAKNAPVACPAGSEDADADPATACTACEVGEHCAGGASAPVACAAGTSDHDEDPATACAPCAPGQYCEGGAAAALFCAIGTVDGDSDATTLCVDCVAGEYCAAGSAVADACPAGTVDADSDPRTPCDVCGLGEYCSGGVEAPVRCRDSDADLDQDPATPCEACVVGSSYDGVTCALEPSESCGATEFTCANGDCIDLALVCDGNPDCPGGGGDDEDPAVCAPPCPEGYTGTYCEISLPNACDPDPCLNGATCVDAWVGYTCECLAGYEGTDCGTNIDDCASNPCLNGGVCIDGVESYTCSCADGYTGPQCETVAATVPYAWFCAEERYGDGQYCDCSCGALDPDCGTPPDGMAVADTGCGAGVMCDLFSGGLCRLAASCATNDQCQSLFCGNDFDCMPGATCNLATNTCSNWDFDPQTAECRGQALGGGLGDGFFPPFLIGECAAPSAGTTADRDACSADGDCASGSCVNGSCSPWCVYDADCGGGSTCTEVLTPPPTDPTVAPPGGVDIPSLAFRRFCVGGSLATSCDAQACSTGECRLYFSILSSPQHFCSDATIDNGAGADVGESCTPGSCQAGLLCYQGACRLPCPLGTPCAGACTSVTVSDWLTEDTADDVTVDLCVP